MREEKEEEERKKTDLEEAQYQAEKRKEAIEKAKTLQYYQTDRVKGFHSALLVSEVMKERDAQISLKKKRVSVNKNEDKDTWAQMQHALEEVIHTDQQKALQHLLQKKEIADFQMQQIKENEHKKEMEKEHERREGEEIKKLAKLFEWEKHNLEQQQKEEKTKLKKSHLEHVSNQEVIKEIEKQKEDEENERIRFFATAKQKMAKLRKDKEAEVHRQMGIQQDRITQLLAAQLKKKLDDEDERIARAVAEQEAKREKEFQEKEEKRMAELKSISEHRISMRKQNQEKAKEEKWQELEMLRAKKEADHVLITKQTAEQQRILQEQKELQNTHIQQMAEKMGKSQKEKEMEIEYELQNNAVRALEEKQFQQYAQQVIRSAAETGRNLYPLIKAAREGIGGWHGPLFAGHGGIRPSYLVQDETGVQLPNYQRETTKEIKQIHDTGDVQQTKKRLGFTW
ncbi:coiled-coil domain-containing protein 173 isoform X2 [Protopterus annectens]|nr:coiled-coil domain-containing protein 173 isoform X2 [Protopterus annectens]